MKVKEITPTDMFKQIARQLDESLDEVIRNDEHQVEQKLKVLEVEEDAAFEFMEQFDTCKEWMADGYQINFVKGTGGDVLTDKLACAVPVVFDPPFTPIAEKSNPTKTLPTTNTTTPAPTNTTSKKDELYTFDEVMAKISQSGQEKLRSENMLLETVLARVTNQDIANLGLGNADLVILRQVVLQCRYHEHTRGGAEALVASIKAHSLHQRFPFTSDSTFAALHQFGIKSANELYLYTPIEKLHELFRLHQITDTDQRAIMTSYSLAQYARNIAKQNNRRRIK